MVLKMQWEVAAPTEEQVVMVTAAMEKEWKALPAKQWHSAASLG